MKLDRQSIQDIAWSVLGGLIGGAATTAFIVHKFMKSGNDHQKVGEQ